MAAVKTARSMSFVMFSLRCPIMTRIPEFSRVRVISEAALSDPETVKPSLARICARPLMDIPPIPTKWTWTGWLKSI